VPWSLHPLVARGTEGILETDSEAVPTFLNSGTNAVHVKDVFALQLNYRFFSKALDIADRTKRVTILFKSLFVIFRYTFFMEARWMLFFTIIAVAIMIAVQESLATIFGFFLTSFLCTAIRMSVLSERGATESTFLCFFVFFKLGTSFSNMIRLLLAL
jgi:hypothetical protein